MENRVSGVRAALVFGGFTVYFFLLLVTIYPFLRANFAWNAAVYWFVTGYLLFVPIFAFAIFGAGAEGNRRFADIRKALRLVALSGRDVRYALGGLGLTLAGTGLVFGLAYGLHAVFGIPLLDTTPWFMEMKPFEGRERLLLLLWLPMFFFNIFGEELLWRGYLQARLSGRFAWLLCSALWLLFHLPFGFQLMILLLPTVIIIPYIYEKTKNTTVGILIHGLFNGPMFVAVALGLIG